MAAPEGQSQGAGKHPEPATAAEPHLSTGKELEEASRFAYAALCGMSLAWLFPEPEQSSFRMEFVESLVKWLELPETVLPSMVAFADGLGGEEEATFAEILLKDPVLENDPLVITQDLLTFSLRNGSYDARARVLVCHVTWLLKIAPEELENLEEMLLESLKERRGEESEAAEALRKKRENRKKWKRYLLIGLATVGGGTAIGVTGGLAAPFMAAGAAAIIGTTGAAALGSVAGIAVITSLFGAAGAGLTGYKMKKRVGAIEEFEFLPLRDGKQLHITIAITGWLCSGKYGMFTTPWASMARSSEQYCLAWESKYLMELGSALETLLNSFVNMMAQEALKYTILSGILTALTWPSSLLAVANVIDNPWGVCLRRSAEVGKHLAHVLLSRQQGRRPVTLIGFSLGARVIYFCLQEMAQEKDCQGIIEDVILLGAPVEGEAKYWKPLKKVVSGRIINGYSRGDWLLSFVYRTSSVQLKVAGLQPVTLDDRKMVNMDLSAVVSGHLDYMKKMDTILKAVGIRTREDSTGDKIFSIAPNLQGREELQPEAPEPPKENAATDPRETIHPSCQTRDPTSSHELAQDSKVTDHPRVSPGPEPCQPQSLDEACHADCSTIGSHILGPNPLGCPDCANNNKIGSPKLN
ncbi:transmembrane and coiled-coil domain-containing protein 4-like isoform X1 [Vombatus ursinus]|uniref:Transmembrane and coiled-coil domains 4 n=1 Tax=Vombatus ursinus TaxID=29139 RepID=A0A4X2K115_VOMUR|nr:transmembrane and coiled-coil domain-containing protein 4-like isoform X1 [Vombatus ursinus]XP_027698513.1 transmembrane and coiled-coil domain-containing protein 4-like isoform X1 [Vombatus ursinus]XP_027698514.1 transmembrane and coiled-coil domain-containing protein 4-like isoform X1 [Vombatus ursinus]XP_027698518.1 transmembrane and coiled-coil domain-containing protein 4-like isoform X1 [Vombatus ursinus]XP_027698519.1 transmembrane and coiled-coil domain-containing protein 4-like isofo